MTDSSVFGAVKRALDSKDYRTAKAECDLALESVERRDSVPFLLARAEALRSLSDSELDQALKDANEAVSIQPKNPESWLCLGRIHQAIAARAFHNGKYLCRGLQQFTSIGQFDGLDIAARKVLDSSMLQKVNPLFLPTEIFTSVLQSLAPQERTICTGVSKGWKLQLESEASLWRDLNITLSDRYDGFSPIERFARDSRNSLRFIELNFQSHLNSDYFFYRSINRLEASSSTLQRLIFKGFLKNISGLFSCLELASQCLQLKHFEYVVEEEAEAERDGSKWIESTFESHQRWLEHIEEHRMDVDLDEFDFNSFPSTITLSSSVLSLLSLGSCNFFSKAKVITLLLEGSGGIWTFSSEREGDTRLYRSTVANLLKAASKTLQVINITQYFPYSRSSKEIVFGTKEEPIRLPKLKRMMIKSTKEKRYGLSEAEAEAGEEKHQIHIVAPRLDPKNKDMEVPAFISILEK